MKCVKEKTGITTFDFADHGKNGNSWGETAAIVRQRVVHHVSIGCMRWNHVCTYVMHEQFSVSGCALW
jgi:hypothetical protein